MVFVFGKLSFFPWIGSCSFRTEPQSVRYCFIPAVTTATVRQQGPTGSHPDDTLGLRAEYAFRRSAAPLETRSVARTQKKTACLLCTSATTAAIPYTPGLAPSSV